MDKKAEKYEKEADDIPSQVLWLRFPGSVRVSLKGQVYPGGHHLEHEEDTDRKRWGVDQRTSAGGPQEPHQLVDGMSKQGRLGYLQENRQKLGPEVHSVGDSRRMKRRDRRYCRFPRD